MRAFVFRERVEIVLVGYGLTPLTVRAKRTFTPSRKICRGENGDYNAAKTSTLGEVCQEARSVTAILNIAVESFRKAFHPFSVLARLIFQPVSSDTRPVSSEVARTI
jgi:hypothetical protein